MKARSKSIRSATAALAAASSAACLLLLAHRARAGLLEDIGRFVGRPLGGFIEAATVPTVQQAEASARRLVTDVDARVQNRVTQAWLAGEGLVGSANLAARARLSQADAVATARLLQADGIMAARIASSTRASTRAWRRRSGACNKPSARRCATPASSCRAPTPPPRPASPSSTPP